MRYWIDINSKYRSRYIILFLSAIFFLATRIIIVRPRVREGSLDDWFFTYSEGPVLMKWEGYLELYDRYFSKFKGKNVTMLEIGIQSGGSIEMWQHYFGPKLNFVGFDINPYCKRFERKNVQIFTGSQLSRADLQLLYKSIGPVDIILDDGGHTKIMQQNSFEELFGAVIDGGYYVVEDIEFSYTREFGSHTFVDYAKQLVDVLNMFYYKKKHVPSLPNFNSDLALNLSGIHFHDNMIVFEKQKRKEPVLQIRGTTMMDENGKYLKRPAETEYNDAQHQPLSFRDKELRKARKGVKGYKWNV